MYREKGKHRIFPQKSFQKKRYIVCMYVTMYACMYVNMNVCMLVRMYACKILQVSNACIYICIYVL